jgi:prophage antirepressor-like protein
MLARRQPPELPGKAATFADGMVRAAVYPEKGNALDFDDMLSILGVDSIEPKKLQGFISSGKVFPAILVFNGRREEVRLIARKDALDLAWISSSPKAMPFREWAKKVLETVLETGRYEEPAIVRQRAAENLPVTPGDPLDAIQVMLDQMRAQRQQIADVDRKATLAIMQSDGRLDEWTTQAWLTNKGHSIDSEIVKKEGRRLVELCRQEGHHLDPKKKDCHGTWAAWRYPVHILEKWYPGFCMRHGIDPR